jgi:hypothetical protein
MAWPLASALHELSGQKVSLTTEREVIVERGAAWVLGTGLALVLLAAPASAQVHVDVGIMAPPVGARVVVGAPRVYVADRYYEPVYVPYDRHERRGRGRERAEHEREYYKDMREARREYEKDRREAEREYWKDVREAQREYEKDRREARRDRRR